MAERFIQITRFRTRLRKYGWVFFISPAFIYLVLTSVYPLINALRMGFFRSAGGEETFIGLTYYIEVLKDKAFWGVLYNSFFFTFLSVIFHLIIGLIFAILLNRKIRGRDVYRSLQFIPWLFPAVVASSIWVLMYQPQYGLVNTFFNKIGLAFLSFNWLGDPKTALTAVTITNIWTWYPFFTLMILAALQNIPEELYEAARIDGGGDMAQFLHITLPLLKPVIMTTSLLDTIWTFRFFDMIWVMTKGGPVRASEILPTFVYKTAFFDFNFNKASAIGGIMVIIMLIFSVIYLRYYISTE